VGAPLGADEPIVGWRIVAGEGQAYFQIDPTTGQLRVKTPADYEALPANNKSLTFTVEATDRAGATVERLVAVEVSDVNEGVTPENWLAQAGITLGPGESIPGPLLNKYAIGGAESPTAAPVPPSLTVQTQGGEPVLALTVLVRTDDTQLNVQAEASSDLGSWNTSGVISAPAGDQDGVPAGFERRVYTVPADATRRFIRLKVSR
jgi:hypothetical protein